MSKEKMLTFEEFEEEAWECYSECLTAYSEEEREEYFEGDKAQELLEERYKKSVELFKNGKRSTTGMKSDAVGAGSCLSMMFD